MTEAEISICAECGSEFIKARSMMSGICPECAHVLYGYENCAHEFKDGRCVNCFCNGQQSDYIKSLKS